MPRNPTPADPARQLMIKTKTCQRLLKEVNYYNKEVKENEATLATMKDEQRDPYDIKKFEEVLGESYMMVPDSESRLTKTLEDLALFVASEDCRRINADSSSEWETAARDILAEHLPKHAHSIKGKQQQAVAGATREDVVTETDVSDLKDDEAF